MKTVTNDFRKISCIAGFWFITLSFFTYGQVFQYPVRPGTREWRALNNTNEKVAACQIPKTILQAISTKDLLITCLEYPLLNNYTASNSPYEGLINIAATFNGLAEFLRRSDAHDVLLAYYIAHNPSEIENRSDKGGYTFIFTAVELLFCHPSIFDRFGSDDQKRILQLLLSKYNEKSAFEQYFGFYGKMTTAFVTTKFITKLDNQSNIYKGTSQKLFVEKMLISDLKVVDELLISVKEYADKIK